MATRLSVVREVLKESALHPYSSIQAPDVSIKKFYGCNTFGDEAMLKHMHKDDYTGLKACVHNGERLKVGLADRVASAMKQWAMDKGVTHYAHWFQPWTGKTAEKHDSFFSLDVRTAAAIEEFGGNQLVQGEPDGSSFPGGGLRSTFEARGYTAWDPASPAFVMDLECGKTLCIPCTFVTFGGHAMDFKLPLLRSQAFLSKAAVPICKLFDPAVTRVDTTLGWEQEYFVIDRTFFAMRPDLVMCGRTLLGKAPPRGQQLEDHYFGSIPERVYAFMRDLEIEAHKLSIPLRTRHNEVAPSQFEAAPMFEEVVVACDHNLLLMDLMERVSQRHHLTVLLHEKPFAGVNGSGKHHNFSLGTNTGKNLLNPGSNPAKNLQFLVFFVNIIKCVHRYADILRAFLAAAANDHRLGANEAPPAIVSVFLGAALDDLMTSIKEGRADFQSAKPTPMDLADTVPTITKDTTDRNRTSPFAFTGNKFEIRMPGSSVNCAGPMTVMNTMLGRQLLEFKAELDTLMKTQPMEKAILSILQRYLKEASPVLFEGDNYSVAWREEARHRGLPITNTTPEALEAIMAEKSKDLFFRSGVYTEEELHGMWDVRMHGYYLTISIEAKTLSEIIINQIIPVALDYQTKLVANITALSAAKLPESSLATQRCIIQQVSESVDALWKGVEEMTANVKAASEKDCARDQAFAMMKTVKPLLDSLRVYADKLEYLLPDKEWPLIKYREMLFLR